MEQSKGIGGQKITNKKGTSGTSEYLRKTNWTQ